MAVPLVPVLAAVATPEWQMGAAATLLLLAGAIWFSQSADEPESGDAAAPSDDGPAGGDGPAGQRAAQDEARIRELQETVDELTRLRVETLEAAQRRDEFLATISHELRGPLNAILGWTQVLQPRRDLPDDVRDALGVIKRNALRQRQLLDDLIDLSRGASGALRIEPRAIRLQDAIDEACQAVGPDMARKRIRLDCDSGTDAVVSGDVRRLQQALGNLLANALRFTPAGGVVSIRTSRIGSEVSIAVSDSGVGIDPAFLPHVFEPFRQQSGSAPHDQATFGLGLALARAIVVAHGGRLIAHSPGPGRGATFTVWLPAVARGDAAAEPPPQAAEAAANAPLAGVRVLAVDDEPDWRELLGHILAAAGADARIAASAAEAIQLFEAWRPDVVLTDIAMPVTDGYGLLSSIRGRGGAGRAVPAIAMTAHAGAQERTRTARAGFAEHLAKPIPPHELVEAVRRVADSSSRVKGAGPG